MDKDRLALIKVYFDLGLKHKEIVCILEERHGYNISIRQLIRILHVHGFYRYKNPTDDCCRIHNARTTILRYHARL
ncbi:hypothetical protein ACJMK2_039832 [Sinanodonta woodiana]|uniref:Clr5 domain-containing protein n=1 Tax=Sinanodonta woodiana TaxID=1069815 RepID=A0ABD3WEC7_SINWO